MADIIATIIEAEAVPLAMLTTIAAVEVLTGVTGKEAKAFVFVLHSMAVHEVHDDADALPVSFVDEFLQLLGSAEAAGGSKEVADVIAKRAVVGMLLNGHDLDAVISCFDYAGQHPLTELVEGAHALLVLRHADVTLVDEQRVAAWTERLLPPLISGYMRIPHLSAEDSRSRILHHALGKGRDALAATTVPLHQHLIVLAVAESLIGQRHLPVAMGIETRQTIFVTTLPVVEIAHQPDGRGVGSPLAEHPAVVGAMEAIPEMAVGKLSQRALSLLRQCLQALAVVVISSFDGSLVRFQPGVVLDEIQHFNV